MLWILLKDICLTFDCMFFLQVKKTTKNRILCTPTYANLLTVVYHEIQIYSSLKTLAI